MTPAELTTLADGDLVDITIRRAEVCYGGVGEDGTLSLALPGVDLAVTIPLVDDEGLALRGLVTVARPAACAVCDRMLPLEEAAAGITVCEHCPTPAPTEDDAVTTITDLHIGWVDSDHGEDLVTITDTALSAVLVALRLDDAAQLLARLAQVVSEAVTARTEAARLADAPVDYLPEACDVPLAVPAARIAAALTGRMGGDR